MRRENISHAESRALSDAHASPNALTSPEYIHSSTLNQRRAYSIHSVASTYHYTHAIECNICQKRFHTFRRKHRCKLCGHAICANCGRTHKLLPLSPLVPYSNEPVRICDRCVQQEQHSAFERRRERDIQQIRARRQQYRTPSVNSQSTHETRSNVSRELEELHLGSQSLRKRFHRSQSLPILPIRPSKKSNKNFEIILEQMNNYLAYVRNFETKKSETFEECAICLEFLDASSAILTTACGHNFHWHCLKELYLSQGANGKYCPSCRTEMSELCWDRQCEHPRVRYGHRFCRDCGEDVSYLGFGSGSGSGLFRAGSYGALVRCPQCQIQMRVLPQMYNMRVACPSGHEFIVQVASSREMGRVSLVSGIFGGNPLPARMQFGFPAGTQATLSNNGFRG